MKVSEIINLPDFPLDQLDSAAGRSLVCKVRESLADDGCCSLENFVYSDARVIMAQQAESLVELAYPGPSEVSPYFFNYKIGENLDLDENHPVRHKGLRNLRQVATDLIPDDHVLSILFRTALMTGFLGKVFDMPVYRNQDKYQSLNISIMENGGCQQWHFDSGQLVTTLLLQAREAGGVFEYVPRIRSDENENFDEVRKVLDRNSGLVKQLEPCEGSLNLFQGHYSLHRVTEVQGGRRRIQAILGYATVPDLVGSLESSILHYGPRVAELENVVEST